MKRRSRGRPGVAPRFAKTASGAPYLDQLARVRRALVRLEEATTDQHEYRDRFNVFFTNCWTLADWVRNDDGINKATRDAIYQAVHLAGSRLLICADLANGSKHYRLDDPKSGTGAGEHHLNFTMYIGGNQKNDVRAFVDDGHGNQILAEELARQCLAQWEQVLTDNGLSVGP